MYETSESLARKRFKNSFAESLISLISKKKDKEEIKKVNKNEFLEKAIREDWIIAMSTMTKENMADLLTDMELATGAKEIDRQGIYDKYVKLSHAEAEKKFFELAPKNTYINEPQRKILTSSNSSVIKTAAKQFNKMDKVKHSEHGIGIVDTVREKENPDGVAGVGVQFGGKHVWFAPEMAFKELEIESSLKGVKKKSDGDTVIQIENLNAGGDVAIKPRELPEGEFELTKEHDHESDKEPKKPKELPLAPKDRKWPAEQTEPQIRDDQEKETGYGGDRGGLWVAPRTEETSLSSLKTKAMWQDHLQNIYSSYEEWKTYSDTYGLAERLGFSDASEAWENNPLIEGSVKPEDYKAVAKLSGRPFITLIAKVVHKGNEWCVVSEKGKNLGCYASKEKAVKRLRQVEYFKHKGSLDKKSGIDETKVQELGSNSGYLSAKYSYDSKLDRDENESIAFEAESNSRDFTPFEFLAKEINESEFPDELWDVYDKGVGLGISKFLDEIEAKSKVSSIRSGNEKGYTAFVDYNPRSHDVPFSAIIRDTVGNVVDKLRSDTLDAIDDFIKKHNISTDEITHSESFSHHGVKPLESSMKNKMSSLNKRSGFGMQKANKDDIKNIYDSLKLTSTNDKDFKKPSFESINNEIAMRDDGYVVVFTGNANYENYLNVEHGYWYELEGVPAEIYEKASLNKKSYRLISEIAEEVRDDWKDVFYGAKPYLDAMSVLQTIEDKYGVDEASSVIAYFLSNASAWHGETAKRIKKELNDMLKSYYKKSSLQMGAHLKSLPLKAEDYAKITKEPKFKFGDPVSLKKDPKTMGIFLKVQDDKPGDIDYLIYYPMPIEVSKGESTHVVETCPVDLDRIEREVSKEELKSAEDALRDYESKKSEYEADFATKVKNKVEDIIDQKEREKAIKKEDKSEVKEEKKSFAEGVLLKQIGAYPVGTPVIIAEETQNEYLFQVKGPGSSSGFAYGWALKSKIEVKAYPAQSPQGYPAGQWATAPKEMIVDKNQIKQTIEREIGHSVSDEEVEQIHHRLEDEYSEAMKDAYEMLRERMGSIAEKIKKTAIAPKGLGEVGMPETELMPTDEELSEVSEILQAHFPDKSEKLLMDLKRVYEREIMDTLEDVLDYMSIETSKNLGIKLKAAQPKPTTEPPAGMKWAYDESKDAWVLIDENGQITPTIKSSLPLSKADVKKNS